jgi:hypothetical protein
VDGAPHGSKIEITSSMAAASRRSVAGEALSVAHEFVAYD